MHADPACNGMAPGAIETVRSIAGPRVCLLEPMYAELPEKTVTIPNHITFVVGGSSLTKSKCRFLVERFTRDNFRWSINHRKSSKIALNLKFDHSSNSQPRRENNVTSHPSDTAGKKKCVKADQTRKSRIHFFRKKSLPLMRLQL